VTDETPSTTAPDPEPRPAAPEPEPRPTTPDPPTSRPGRALSSADPRPRRPDYRGAELDPERGPGLGCFWFQVIVLGFFIVLIPIGLELNWPFELLALLLFIVIGLLLLTGQSVIFLLRLVAADRRAQGRRRPLASPTKTVGELEDDHAKPSAGDGSVAEAEPAEVEPAEAEPAVDDRPGDARGAEDDVAAEAEPLVGTEAADPDQLDGSSPGEAAPAPEPEPALDHDETVPAPEPEPDIPDELDGGVPRAVLSSDVPPEAAPPEEPDPGVPQ
jgi:hypothetical protein